MLTLSRGYVLESRLDLENSGTECRHLRAEGQWMRVVRYRWDLHVRGVGLSSRLSTPGKAKKLSAASITRVFIT
eukprot:IDg16064t1